MSELRILFFGGFISPSADYKASDAVGYGITTAGAIVDGLPRLGIDVTPVRPRLPARLRDPERQRLAWILGGYMAFLELALEKFDAAFIFHAFQQFPSEMRRLLFDLRIRLPLIGYTHGSHWDPTDTYRFEHYPGMEVADLANLLSLDRVLVVTEYMRSVILRNVRAWQPDAARALEPRLAVVGLPVNTTLMDACFTREKFQRPTIVFNHSIIASKGPDLFAQVAADILGRHDVDVVLTRNVPPGPFQDTFHRLIERYPDRVRLEGTLRLEDYYRLLWMADFQVSTATHEGFGVATLEAMYTRNCCLLPNRCSYPEITSGYEDILYSTPEELIEKLDYFIRHEEERRQAADRLHNESLRYAADQVVPQVAAVIREVVAESRG
jgi:glycosyltransferase involved in cell wall biosynthesis